MRRSYLTPMLMLPIIIMGVVVTLLTVRVAQADCSADHGCMVPERASPPIMDTWCPQPQAAAEQSDFALDPDQIKAALHTTNDIEGGFIDRTVGMVQAGTLPRDLFTSCFIWARKKPRHQFQYFKQALTIRAAEIGITL